MIDSPRGLIWSSKSARCAPSRALYMRRSCASLGDDTQTMLKQERMRCEKGLRPPPGGAIAASSCMSRISLRSHRSRSYQYPLSTHSLSSSRGGMKPNADFCGMFRSSMKATRRLPPTGANTPLLLFSNRPSIVSYTHGLSLQHRLLHSKDKRQVAAR